MDLIINNIQLQFMNYVSTNFKLNNLQYQLVANGLGYVIDKCKTFISLTKLSILDLYNNIHIIMLLILSNIILLLIYKFYYYYYHNYQIIKISNNDKYKDILHQYMSLNKEIFKTTAVDFLLDNKYIEDKCIYSGKVYFNDTNFNQSGFLHCKTHTLKLEKEILYFNDIILHINKSNYTNDCKNYLEQISDYIKEYNLNVGVIEIEFIKLLKTCVLRTHLFKGKLVDLKNENIELYDSYFHKNKSIINDLINNTTSYNNIILYGPGGTGKSKFIYLCARLLQCNVLSIDLSLYINNKTDLFTIFAGCRLDYDMPKHKCFSYKKYMYSGFDDKKVIIVLEELDYAIDAILENENSLKNENSSKSDKTTTSNIDKSDMLHLSDLLELFQSIVPYSNRYIFATTNNLDKVKDIIPPLFRPGRLTPISHTYIEWKELNEICQYYYNEITTLEPVNILIPTSQIIEEITQFKLNNKTFLEFEMHLKKNYQIKSMTI